MVTTLADAIRVLEKQTSEDPGLAEAVLFIAQDAEGTDDPFGDVPVGALRAARLVNERRLRERRETASASALDTAEVVALLHSVNDRKGVDRRRRRGQLLAWRSGAHALHPAWQFDKRRGETRLGLPRVLNALSQVAPDPRAADALMRAPREDLGGRSLADLLASERPETVIRLILASVDQS
jgi:hypothetical protein